MNYNDRLENIKSNLKFLKLNEDKVLGTVAIPKGFTIPINRDSVENIEDGNFNFNFFHIVQNMLFCVSFCDDLPLNSEYNLFLKDFFRKTDRQVLDALLDLRQFEDPFQKAGVLYGFSSYVDEADSYLMTSYEFIDIHNAEKDEEYIKIAKDLIFKSYNIEKRAYSAYLLSYVYHHEKDYVLAMDYAEIALGLDPDEKLREAIEEDIKEIKLLLDISTTREMMASNDYLGALNYLKSNLREDSWEQNYMMGEIYLALERPDMSLEYLKVALEINPTEPDIYESMGVATYFMGDVTNSIKFLEHGLKIDPRHAEILKNLATLYSQTARSDIALKLLDKAKKFYPDDREIDVLIMRIKERFDA